MYRIAVIGSGSRMTPLVKMLAKYDDFEIAAICDTDIELVKEKYEDYPGISWYADAREMLDTEKADCIMIGTRCSTHTHFAKLAAKYDIPIFLEKPVCTRREDLEKLEKLSAIDLKTVVSFPLRNCAITKCVREIINSGKIGTVAHVQAYNNVPYARGYYHKWYRDDKETGGLFLQKATHDFDYVNDILGDVKPIKICAMTSKQVFRGNMPAGLKCKDCAKRTQCSESDINVESYGDRYSIGEYCCFATDTGNEDSGSAIIRYENGIHAVYSQDFIARKGAGKRGARFIGYLGTVEFDFLTGIVKVFYHNEAHTETHQFDTNGHHFGGDKILLENFADVVRGTDVSHAPLSDGILSARMCLAAKESAENEVFRDI